MKFITDIGEAAFVKDDEGNLVDLGRYGVWTDEGLHEPTVIDVSTDLEALQAKHGPNLQVIVLKRTDP